jgi:hypothetical protein
MSITDYLLNGVLVAFVLIQIRGRRITGRNLILPLAIVAVVAVKYLHSVPIAGNDLLLVIVGAAAGLLLGTGCGLATAVFRRGDGAPVAKAGALAAVLWVAGVGSRLAFSLYAQHGGGPAIGRFMIAHQITTGQAWIACLVLMALAEVVSRTAVLGAKYAALTGRGRGAARSLGGADVPAQLS